MYSGPPIDDPAILDELPPGLRHLYSRLNGYVAYQGGLHVRGACHDPAWHSLRRAWHGPDAFHELYSDVAPTDIPFAEDALGDQFLLRDGLVHRLQAESGDIEATGLNLAGFDARVREDPVGFLGLEPLEAFRAGGGVLEPGELLSAYPPFVAQRANPDVAYRAVPALDRRRWLADLALQVRSVPDGGALRITEPGV